MGLPSRARARCCQLLVLVSIGAAGAAAAEPMDLSRFESRWVAVRFETSPADRPGQTDTVYTPPYAAWLEAERETREIRVTVPGEVVEAHLLDGNDPVRGSFSDFTWTFDADTGEVTSACVEGRLWHHLPWGVSIEAPIRVQMDTRHAVGFAPPRRLLGHEYRSLCRAGDGCTVVEPRLYDRETGYVNAVGEIQARSGPFRVRSFSPLGEAIFSELPGGSAGAAAVPGAIGPVSAPPPPDARGSPEAYR